MELIIPGVIFYTLCLTLALELIHTINNNQKNSLHARMTCTQNLPVDLEFIGSFN